MHNSLKSRIWITLALFLFLGLIYSGMRGILLPSFTSLERQELTKDVERCHNMFASELQQLAATAGDYAGWDEAYSFVQTGSHDFIKTNLNPSIFSKLRINLLVYTNKEGVIVYGKHVDWRTGAVSQISPALLGHLSQSKKLLDHSEEQLKIVSGLLQLPEGLMMVASHPVMTSNYQGPIMGTLVIGRHLDSIEVAKLAGLVNLPMTVVPTHPASQTATSQTVPYVKRISTRLTNADTIVGTVPLSDIYDRAVATVHITEPRRIYKQGLVAVNTFFLVTALITAIIAVLITMFLRKLSQANHLLRESESRWKFAIEGSGDGVWDWDIPTNETKCSTRCEEMLGYAEGDILPSKQEWGDRIHPDDKSHVAEAMQAYLEGKTASYVVEYRLRCKDDSYKWLLDRGMVVSRGEDNKPLRMIGTHTDISERKRTEEEKRILEKQYQQAQKLESLGVLASGIAHDFNNILQIIIGYCSLIIQRPETAKNHVPQIEKAANRAAGLCRQMMTYGGKTQFVMTRVNIWLLVDEMVKMLKSTIKQNVVIKTDLSSDVNFINADASQIRQIVMNLIINASEAIGDAHGEIIVSLAKKTIKEKGSEKDHLGAVIAPGYYACLGVTDNGCGMDDETKRRLFEPFYTTKFTGRGLGMSSALGIITAHGGALQLSSQTGLGTTFKIYLPIQNRDSAVHDSHIHKVSTTWKGNGTILLVEDEEQIRSVAKTMLTDLGFAVIEATNGKEALILYQKNAADITLIVTDIGMPIMDGCELIHELKTIHSELPIIISSGYGDPDITSRITSEDIIRQITKPYNFDQLREVLKNTMENALSIRPDRGR